MKSQEKRKRGGKKGLKRRRKKRGMECRKKKQNKRDEKRRKKKKKKKRWKEGSKKLNKWGCGLWTWVAELKWKVLANYATRAHVNMLVIFSNY